MVCPVVTLVQSSQNGGLWLWLDLFSEARHSACFVYTGQTLSSQMEGIAIHHLTVVCWGHAVVISYTRSPVFRAKSLQDRQGKLRLTKAPMNRARSVVSAPLSFLRLLAVVV